MPVSHSSLNALVATFAYSLSATSLSIAAQESATAKSPNTTLAPGPDSGVSKPGQTMSNADVFTMLSAKLSSDIIVGQIERADSTNFDLTTENLIKLKKQGATDDVLKAMMSKRDSHVATPTAATQIASPSIAPSVPAAETGAPDANRATAVANQAAEGRPCVANFSVTGNLMSARTGNTFQEYPTGKKSTAFPYLIQKISALGYKITASDKDSGLISAENEARFTGGRQSTTTNVVVAEQSSGGIRVQLTYKAPFGVTFNRDKLQDAMCSVLEGVPN